MFQPTLLFDALFTLTEAGLFFYIGQSLNQRHIITPDARLAWAQFILWWYGLAGALFAGGLTSLLGILGITDLPLFITITDVILLTTCAALYGLVYYLLYLFLGSRRILAPLTSFYVAYYILLKYYLNWRIPTGVLVGRWSADVQYKQPMVGAFFALLLVLLVFPQIIGSVAYFSLYFRVKEITQKYRILLVSGSIFITFSSSFLASAIGLSQQDWWQITSRLIGLAMALAMLMAYRPIPWIKRRFGVVSITEEVS